jgi:hypothetical protein
MGHSNSIVTEHYLSSIDTERTFKINQSLMWSNMLETPYNTPQNILSGKIPWHYSFKNKRIDLAWLDTPTKLIKNIDALLHYSH